MAQLTRAQLKALWVTGYTPTETDFENLFDSILTLLDPNSVYSQYASNLNAIVFSSPTTAIDWDDGNVQSITLTGNVTFTFANPLLGGRYLLLVKQGNVGSNTVTWPATVLWSGGTAPTLTTTLNKVDIITFVWDGTNYFGGSNLNY